MSYGQVEVWVWRKGQPYLNPDDTGARCANSGIRPGDVVEVLIRQEERGYAVMHAAAGQGYRCGVR